MARYARLFLPGYPHHIVQRGHDRLPVFADSGDYRLYLVNLHEQAERLEISVIAYCLMTNHVHLLVQPEAEGADLSRLMKVLAARQTRHVNRLEHRSGTLWEGRFRSSLVDSKAYLLACCRYIDLNPVRAGLVHRPADYPWSGYRARVGEIEPIVPLVTPGPFATLGDTEEDMRVGYREFVAAGTGERELARLRVAVNRNQLTGDERFKTTNERKLERRISSKGPGRPRKSETD